MLKAIKFKLIAWNLSQKRKKEIRSLRISAPLEGGAKWLRNVSHKQTSILKKKCEVVGLFSSSNLQVTISKVSISVLKGRPKRKIRPTEGLLCFCILFYFPIFYKRALTNSYVWPLHYTASQYLIESFTVRCIFSLRRDIGKQTITFFANNNYNTIFNLFFFFN